METASNFLADNILLLGMLIIAGLVIAVVFAALKHALVRQLESRVDELKQVVEKTPKTSQRSKNY